jgi:hypothetical protein
MKRMESPSAVEVAVATARMDPGAITTMTTGMKVAIAMVYHVQISSRYCYLHQRTIIGKRTRGLSRVARFHRLPPRWIPSSFV